MKAASFLKPVAKRLLERLGLSITSALELATLREASNAIAKLDLIAAFDNDDMRRAIPLIGESKSQLGQDLAILSQLAWKRNGYFVEFGAADGRAMSNSWLLEKEFAWQGILAEPARVWRSALSQSGRSAHIEYDCVWDKTGEELEFCEASWAEISTLASFRDQDHHSASRRGAKTYRVATISLNDLLAKHQAPPVIDYLSIDTEGSEYRILSSLDFDKWKFRAISCEHNDAPNRQRIFELLRGQGYERRFEKLSQFDDWYFLNES